MTVGALLLVAVAVLLLVLVIVLTSTANRLDRLHVRTDAGWAALDAALARRAVVARAVASHRIDDDVGRRIRDAADGAEGAARAERETAENGLTRVLVEIDQAALPTVLAEELDDAEQRVMIARRVYNDAVRDTLALRRRRKVRYFRLAGSAPTPEYFEIAEPNRQP